MKKALRTALICAIIISALTVWAAAADYTAAADNLKEMGLFIGTGSGYALDSPATRGQAATMLVRLLGLADEVDAGSYSHPFTDVPEWVTKQVGYMYETGLTKGVGDNKFDTDGRCTRQMYATFILRALGYTEEAGDFTYENAEKFARSILLEPESDGEFLRGDMAAMSYSALFLPVKDGSGLLIEKLAEDGAVSASVADKFIRMHNAYGELKSVSMPEGGARMTTKQVSSSVSSGITVKRTVNSEITVEDGADGLRLMTVSDMVYLGAESTRTVWYGDGVLYYRGAEGSFRVSLDDASALTDSFTAATKSDYTGFYNVKSLTVRETAVGTVYELIYSALNMDKRTAQLLMGGENVKVKSGDVKITVSADEDGALISWSASGKIAADADGRTVEQDVSFSLTVIETGPNVTVTMPDPAEFKELPGSYAGMLKGLV